MVRELARYPWDDDVWTVLSTRHLDHVRQAGALTALPFVLTNRSSVCAFFGELDEAAANAEELRAAPRRPGPATVPYGALALAGLRGHEAERTALTRTTVGDDQARSQGLAPGDHRVSQRNVYLGRGRYGAALAAAGGAGRYHDEGRRSGR